MPRQARQRRETGVHHIVVQGKRRAKIFAQDSDKELYLDTLLKYKEKTGVEIYAFCILENHVHLVLKESEDVDVSGFMRRVGVSYAYWYRREHPELPAGFQMFRGRYLSEPVESEGRLLEVVRYVHQEPVKTGLAEKMEEYPWSSYRLYLKGGSFIDSRLILDSLHFGGGYLDFMQEEAQGYFLEEVPLKYGRSDEEAMEILQEGLQRRRVSCLEELTEEEQKNFLRMLRYGEGVSIQQLARVSGVNRGIIQRL